MTLCMLGKYSTTELHPWSQHCHCCSHHHHHYDHYHQILYFTHTHCCLQGSFLPPPPLHHDHHHHHHHHELLHQPILIAVSQTSAFNVPQKSAEPESDPGACPLSYWAWPRHVTQPLLVAAEALVPSSLTSILAFCRMWETCRLSDPVPRKHKISTSLMSMPATAIRSNLRAVANSSLWKGSEVTR